MSKVRKITVIIMTLAILYSLFIVAFADTSIDVEDTVVTSTINPYEYGTSLMGPMYLSIMAQRHTYLST